VQCHRNNWNLEDFQDNLFRNQQTRQANEQRYTPNPMSSGAIPDHAPREAFSHEIRADARHCPDQLVGAPAAGLLRCEDDLMWRGREEKERDPALPA
jgi:hypothetical protein